jgi:hypothetical protein
MKIIAHKEAQIAIEFLLVAGIAFAIILTFLLSALSISENNTKKESYYTAEDLGNSLQQEFLLAAELEDGYTRKINLPMTLNNLKYNITIAETNHSYYYLIVAYEKAELYYMIPPVNGTLKLGNNMLVKNNNILRIN